MKYSITLLLLLASFSSSLGTSPPTTLSFPNPRLRNAYIALQAWKKAITSDPLNFTGNWKGSDVCSYTGVFCAPPLDNPYSLTAAGIDLNHANIAGTLPSELGLLSDLALFHLNSNRFSGVIPSTITKWTLLYELDISNNLFNCPFPKALLSLPSLKFLDIRYNYFVGPVPSKLFDLNLDAIFINNNFFSSKFPKNIGNSPVSVANLANNHLPGCLPSSIGKMAETLEEIILMDIGLKACLPHEIGLLGQATVFDVSFNALSGPLPGSVGNMAKLEQLNVAHNMLTGNIPASICGLPKLENFTYSFNFLTSQHAQCLHLKGKDDRFNCIPNRPSERPAQECEALAIRYPVSCSSFSC